MEHVELVELPGGYPNERSIRAIFFLNSCEVVNDPSNGTHTGVKSTAARYDRGDVLHISGRLKLFMTLQPEVMTSHATALNATVTGAITGAFAVWLGH